MALSVAIIGAGPSGFYAAEALLQNGIDVQIDIIERLPTPFGLVRAGVAPDHQNTKQVIHRFEDTAVQDVVRFFGNVEVGRDVALNELRQVYDAVILAVGAPMDRDLGIPGENLPNVFGASTFVGWYNGHPDFCDLNPDLDTASAIVIGNGNVALDIARVLVRSADELAASDIADYALHAIQASPIRDVFILGRRGPADTKFTPQELREMSQLSEADPVIEVSSISDNGDHAPPRERRAKEKILNIFRSFEHVTPHSEKKRVHFCFFTKPVEILGTQRVEAIRTEQTMYKQDQLIGTGSSTVMPCGLVVSAIGYRGSPLPGIPYDPRRGLFINEDGRIDAGLYAVGWAKRGPTGVIGTNRPDGLRCAEQIIADMSETAGSRPARIRLKALLESRNVQVVTFEDWLKLDAAEVSAAESPAPRLKFTSFADMLAVIADDDFTAASGKH